jgi:oligo-1,6-glucosidase
MEKRWWQTSVGYQIYPRSFYDSNNDGIGDLRGIIQKLNYLEDLGVNLLWICPFYTSPMDDNGYDVSDYYSVDPLFGTFDDAKELITKAKARGIRVILDLVMNQTSDEHPWFIESRSSKENPKRDFYIWKDPKINELGERIPPNNWASFFGGSCWNFDETTGQYYMKIFSNKMPDLNWENESMRKAMYDMASFWLDLGVDGFRIDAIAHLAKDLTFEDSTMELNEDGVAPDWKKYSNRPRLFEYLAEFHDEVLSKYDIVTVGEVGGGADVDDAKNYAAYSTKGFNMVFNFDHCWYNGAWDDFGKTKGKLPVDVLGLKKRMNHWIKGSEDQMWIPHYWLNHDHPRVMSQYGDPEHYHRESGSMLGMLLLSLPGTPFIYNGEEIGMTNVNYSDINDFKDVWVKNFMLEAIKRHPVDQIMNHLNRTSRDNARTPMQWNSEPHGGFTQGTPHQKAVSNYTTINVASQQNDPMSIYGRYKAMIHLRKDSAYTQTLVYGSFDLIEPLDPKLYAFKRVKDKTLVFVANFSDQVKDITHLHLSGNIVLNNYETVSNQLQPYQAVLIEC